MTRHISHADEVKSLMERIDLYANASEVHKVLHRQLLEACVSEIFRTRAAAQNNLDAIMMNMLTWENPEDAVHQYPQCNVPHPQLNSDGTRDRIAGWRIPASVGPQALLYPSDLFVQKSLGYLYASTEDATGKTSELRTLHADATPTGSVDGWTITCQEVFSGPVLAPPAQKEAVFPELVSKLTDSGDTVHSVLHIDQSLSWFKNPKAPDDQSN